MNPGSLERIAMYRCRADAGQSLFEELPTGDESIPILPPNDNRIRILKEMEGELMPTIEQAIEILTSDEAPTQIQKRIDELESELAKLKRFHRVLSGGGGTSRAGNKLPPMKVDSEEEEGLVAMVKKHGPLKPKELTELTGINYMTIGKMVRASSRLTNERGVIEICE